MPSRMGCLFMHIELSSKSPDKCDASDACLFLQGGFSNEISTPALTIELLWSSQVIQMLILSV